MKQLEGKEAGLREETEETEKDHAPHPHSTIKRSTIKDAHSSIKDTEAARARTGGGLKLPETIEKPQAARRRRGAGAQEGGGEELAAAGEEKEGLMDEMEEEADSYEPSQVSSRIRTSPTSPLLRCSRMLTSPTSPRRSPHVSEPLLTYAHACSRMLMDEEEEEADCDLDRVLIAP
jgi:hypothetical protein